MKKKIVSLLLALAACLSLTVPALADGGALFIMDSNGDHDNYYDSASGNGWAYDAPTNTLKLNNANLSTVYLNRLSSQDSNPTLVLAPGSKNIISEFFVDTYDDTSTTLTIRGTGELIVQDNGGNSDAPETGSFTGGFASVKLEDGLKVTGGTNPGDSNPLKLVSKKRSWNQYSYRTYDLNGQSATYVHIAPAVTSITGFSDVAAGSAFEQAIKWAVDQKITNGITAATFGPGNTCTVRHILTFLWRAAGQPSGTMADWALELGLDATNLDAPCTRAMAVEFMWKANGSPKPSKNASFSDVPSGAAYADAVSWAVEKGVTNGTGGTNFSPNNTCTRGQIVTFLYRAK